MNDNVVRALEFMDGVEREVASFVVFHNVLGSHHVDAMTSRTDKVTFVNDGSPDLGVIVTAHIEVALDVVGGDAEISVAVGNGIRTLLGGQQTNR